MGGGERDVKSASTYLAEAQHAGATILLQTWKIGANHVIRRGALIGPHSVR